MRFSIGIFDFLFGKKDTIELTDSDGEVVRRRVSRKWFRRKQEEGVFRRLTEFRVHLLSPGGYEVEQWFVGRDVDAQTYEEFRDPETGDVYVLKVFKEGQPTTYFLKRDLWDEAKARMDAV